MSEEEKAKERWKAHEATAKELAKIEKQLVDLNKSVGEMVSSIQELVQFIKGRLS